MRMISIPFEIFISLPKADVFLNSIFQFLTTDTNIPLCHKHTGMLKQSPHQLYVVVIVHVDIGGECFTKGMAAYSS